MTANRPLRVFLCHSSNDKPAVRELYQKLRAETWIEPWLDEEELYPGHDWNMEIEKAVKSSDVVLVCLSNSSINKKGYVQKELRFALETALDMPEETIFIIPVRLEECTPPRSLRGWQYADYFEGQRDLSFERLLSSLDKRAKSLRLIVTYRSSAIEKQSRNDAIPNSPSGEMITKELPEVKKINIPRNRHDHHTALLSEPISTTSSSGVKFLVSKLQWGKNEFGYSLHAEPTSFSFSGMQTTDFLAYLGFRKETCQFVGRRVCYTTWIDDSFNLTEFATNFGEAFSKFEDGEKLLQRCGYFLYQPEGWEYFNPNSGRRKPRYKNSGGGDGHNANRVELMKKSEDDDFIYHLSWIERATTSGWVFHYQLKNPSNEEFLSVINFLDLNTFNECPTFEFEKCFWMFIEYETKSDDVFEGNAEFAHSCYGSHANNFSKAVRMLFEANKLMSNFGFSFLNVKFYGS